MSCCTMCVCPIYICVCALMNRCLQKEPEGIMSVKFRDALSAQACVVVRLLFPCPWPFPAPFPDSHSPTHFIASNRK